MGNIPSAQPIFPRPLPPRRVHKFPLSPRIGFLKPPRPSRAHVHRPLQGRTRVLAASVVVRRRDRPPRRHSRQRRVLHPRRMRSSRTHLRRRGTLRPIPAPAMARPAPPQPQKNLPVARNRPETEETPRRTPPDHPTTREPPMSGIVAYTGTRPAAPVILTEAARGAASKGPHGHGWVTDNDGAHRTLGPWNSHLFTDTTTGARWLLGHSRLATNGRHRDTTALQPLEHNGHWGVHNGNVYNAHDLWPDAPVDSAALIKVYADHRAHDLPPRYAMDATVEAANMP